uniref:Cytochrome b5 heme-binding domain-containing protein n=1 Tax=Rhodosorus marinus TaxID=101924 RepID=A0A7S2ZZ35_9RHOD|mmetsp:Transcript_38484/g.151880  ORF Transcript_38484/g.151880 Transcript_38484/m.151880 type:complete len:146 (+) Transcript_38484:347-784(+)
MAEAAPLEKKDMTAAVRSPDADVEFEFARLDIFSSTESVLHALFWQELAEYNGTARPEIYIAVTNIMDGKTSIFDMTSAKDFYGPGGPYGLFAGKNASHGLAKSSLDEKEVVGDVKALSDAEKDTLHGWYMKYASKYPQVGTLID